MKEEYYIQGDPARAEEIKAAFEKKGCTLYRLASKCDSEDLIYYSLNGIVRGIKKNNLYLFEYHPGYKELELPVEPEFEVDDWIVRGSGFVYEPSLITEIRDYYICELQNGKRVTYTLNDVHKNFHLWTVADAKDGDVLAYQDEIFIARMTSGLSVNVAIDYDCCYDGNSFILDSFYSLTTEELKRVYPATKEKHDQLFAKMRESGYTWDEKKKELKKIQPHYDIADFHAGMPVLVRDKDNRKWCYLLYSHYDNTYEDGLCFNAGSVDWRQCIPFEGNEHLLGTTDPCDERYINW